MKCPDCKGTGRYIGFTAEEDCATCHGSGEVARQPVAMGVDPATGRDVVGLQLVSVSNPDPDGGYTRKLLELQSAADREFAREFFNEPGEEAPDTYVSQCGRRVALCEQCDCHACHIFDRAADLIHSPRELTVLPSAEASGVWVMRTSTAAARITQRELLMNGPRHPFIRDKLVALGLLRTGQCCYRDHDRDGNCDRHPRNLVREAFEEVNGGPLRIDVGPDPMGIAYWLQPISAAQIKEVYDYLRGRFTPPPPADPASQTVSARRP